jgi:hypothetical protein
MLEATMDSTIANDVAAPDIVHSLPRLGWPAQVASLWAAAGSPAAGGLVATLVLMGRMHPAGSLLVTTVLAATGGILGMAHGAVLGYLGRHVVEQLHLRKRDRAFAVLVATASLLGASALAVWLVLSAVLLRSGNLWGWPALATGAAAAFAIAAMATIVGWRSLERAYAEWPEHNLGATLLAGSFAVLCIVFLALRPAIPGTSLELSVLGWVIVVALATVWLGTPAVVIALRLGRHRKRH